MRDQFDYFRTRLLPAVLTAGGVTLLAAGLLTYTVPVAAEPVHTPSPRPTASAAVTPSPRITLPPLGTPDVSPSPTPNPNRVATRVRIKALDIDLPVIEHRTKKVPCDVALYNEVEQLARPGQGRATYLYAHARTGMFLPLLERSKVNNGKRMIGTVIELWTDDDLRMLFEITEVLRHVPVEGGFDRPLAAKKEELWLQTSEGPGVPDGQPRNPLLQIVAKPLFVGPADHGEANPKAKPRAC